MTTNISKPHITDPDTNLPFPGKFYGREKEIKTLLDSYKTVQSSEKVYTNITGSSGIGKTTLVFELFKPLVENSCYFISGKCDQMKGSMPYNSIIQAFRGFVKHILNFNRQDINKWNRAILDAVSPFAQVIIDVIPEIEEIIGPQEKNSELATEESQNRFNMVFTRFIRVFTESDRPLVMFIDDLQWVDSATMTLLKYLLIDPDIHSFYLIGSFRDNEVGEFHRVSIVKKELVSVGLDVAEICVPPLCYNDISNLITDTLQHTDDSIKPLAEFTLHHTSGNPLYINQFLKTLCQENLLIRDNIEGWKWDYKKIESSYGSADAADLMAKSIMKLPEREKYILKLASCVGNTFEIDTIKYTTGMSIKEIASPLTDMLSAGYIKSSWNDYSFSHDKVYEAAYAMISPDERQEIHYKIGKSLLNNFDSNELNEKIFDIVNQLNLGSKIILENHEEYMVSELNFQAGIKARLSVAYESAAIYFTSAMNILPAGCWSERYELTKEIATERFECEYLAGNLEQAYELFSQIKANSRTNIEIAQLYNLNSMILMNMGKPHMAIRFAIQGLQFIGVNIRENPSLIQLWIKKILLSIKLRNKNFQTLMDMPEMGDALMKSRMSVLLNIWFPAHLVSNKLRRLISYKMVEISLRHGNCDLSPVGFLGYGITLGLGPHKYRDACDFGRFALSLNEKYINRGLNCRLNTLFGAYMSHWRYYIDSGIRHLQMAHKIGLDSGELYYAGLSALYLTFLKFFKGETIDNVKSASKNYLNYSIKNKDPDLYNGLYVFYQNTLCFKGQTKNEVCLDDENFNEQQFIIHIKKQELLQPYYLYLICKARLLLFFERYEEALECCPVQKELFEYHHSTIVISEYIFIKSLILLSLYEKSGKIKKIKYLFLIKRYHNLMKIWKDNCPENFTHKHLIIDAEIKRIQRKDVEAIRLYNMAIDSARENHYISNEAIANELAARFYISRSLDSYAVFHLNQALACYRKWGFVTKVNQLENKYKNIIVETSSLMLQTCEGGGHVSNQNSAINRICENIDRISKEKKYSAVMRESVNVISEISGAERCCILLMKNSIYCIEIEKLKGADSIKKLNSIPVSHENLPLSIIKNVFSQDEIRVIRNVSENKKYIRDPYVIKYTPDTVAFIPVSSENNVDGIIYVEFDKSVCSAAVDYSLKILKLIVPGITVSIINSLKTTDETDDDINASLREIDIDKVSANLDNLMEKQKLYRIEDLTLNMLAQELDIPAHHLSKILNEKLNVNFSKYINRYRIEEAKLLLISETEMSVIDIAYEAGFSSLSTFYSAFLKFTGISPAKYRKDFLQS